MFGTCFNHVNANLISLIVLPYCASTLGLRFKLGLRNRAFPRCPLMLHT